MKKLVIIFSTTLLLLSSCASHKSAIFNNDINDDVYANPKEDRVEYERLSKLKKQVREEEDRRYNDSIATLKRIQKEKDDANPYYKDREFKYDDYYDYEYATRVKRFNNNINGLSYYDNYYTNSYWYNQNPYNYGISVYNGYSWWGPSYNSYSYNPSINFYNSWGWGYGNQFGYNSYTPYMQGYMNGYNNGYNNGYFGNYYGYGSPYGYGMNNYWNPYGYGGFGYGNSYYNNSWGYYNSYDNNSSYTYGPRTSHGGGNSQRSSNPGVTSNNDSYYYKYVSSVTEKQNREVKFTDVKNNRELRGDFKNVNATQSTRSNADFDNVKASPSTNTFNREKNTTGEIQRKEGVKVINGNAVRIDGNEKTPLKTNDRDIYKNIEKTAPVKNIENRSIETNPRYESPSMRNNNMQSSPSNNGGTTTPANSGGRRPR